jgi:hypothetical protein
MMFPSSVHATDFCSFAMALITFMVATCEPNDRFGSQAEELKVSIISLLSGA